METSRLTFNLASNVIRVILPKFSNTQICNSISKRYFSKITYSDKGNSFSISSSCRTTCNTMNQTALVLLAEGAEELESITIIDVLRRGGVQVTIAGMCGPEPVKCRCETYICPDKPIEDAIKAGPYSAIIIPGGLEGAKMLAASNEVGRFLRKQERLDGIIGAICAGPTVLKAHNIGKGKCITSYPSVANDMKEGDVYQYKDDCPVVVDGKLITSRGPATALIFSYTVLEQLRGICVAKEVAAAMLYEY